MPEVIYPPSITTDKDKLAACYSLIQQMINEYNRQSMFASEKKLSGEFRRYTKEQFSPKLKQVLAERNRLMGKIRWDNYTPETWQVATSTPEKEAETFIALFGDKSAESVKETLATSPVLDDLKAIDLTQLSSLEGVDPTEDFTTFTEYDEGSDITITDANTISFGTLNTRSDSYWVYKSKGSGHFSGNFEHRIKWYIGSKPGVNPFFIPWLLANSPDSDYKDKADASEDVYFSRAYWAASYPYSFWLTEKDGATANSDYDSSVWTTATWYFETVERDEAVGDYGTLYCWLCTGNYYGEAGSILQSATSVALINTSPPDFQYVYALISYDDGDGHAVADGYVEDLDLQEEEPTALELRSSTDTRADLSLQTTIEISLRSSTSTRADLSIEVTLMLELRSSTSTRASVTLDTLILISLKSSTDTRADLTIQTIPSLQLRSFTDNRAVIALTSGIAISLRSYTETRASIELNVLTGLVLRSFSDTRADLALETLISISLRSITETRADIELTLPGAPISLVLRSVSDSRADLVLQTGIEILLRTLTDTRTDLTLAIISILSLRSISDSRMSLILSTVIDLMAQSQTLTRTALTLTIIQAVQLELRTITLTRADISLDTLIVLLLASSTLTRAALLLTTVYRHQEITMAMLDRNISMRIPSRTFGQEVSQED